MASTASGLPSSSNAARRWRLARTGPGVVSYSTSWTRPLANAKRMPLVTSSPARSARPASLPACSGSIPPRRATRSKSKVRPATAATRSSSSASGPTWRTRNSTAICSEVGTAAGATEQPQRLQHERGVPTGRLEHLGGPIRHTHPAGQLGHVHSRQRAELDRPADLGQRLQRLGVAVVGDRGGDQQPGGG
jgi:hypothetical protein